MSLTLAVDIGGTKLAVGIVNEMGELLERQAVSSPNDPLARPAASGESGAFADDPIFAALQDLIQTFAPFDRFESCGVGCGGPMTIDGEFVSPLNIGAWRSFPLAQRLRQLTGLPVRVENDAKALALAEGWVGGAVGIANYMAMVVSTGVGGGIVLDGRLLHGRAGNAGHVGHVVVRPGGFKLPGHAAGVLEAEISGTGIAARTGAPAAEADRREMIRSGRLLGRAVGSVCNLLDLELVLVAGSVALGFGETFFSAAQDELRDVCTLDHSREARIVPAGCGDEGPLIGAAAVGRRLMGHPILPSDA